MSVPSVAETSLEYKVKVGLTLITVNSKEAVVCPCSPSLTST